MADLSAYISIAVEFDKSADEPVIRITDTSDYPVGVATGITGEVKILQPDGIEIEGLITDTFDLRLANDDNFQRGQYVITYTAKHASYDDTETTKTFYLFYKAPTLSIEPAFDPFTPSLKAKDTTEYFSAGLTLDQTVRSWEAVMTNVGTTTAGNLSEFDIKYQGAYYDTKHLVKLTSVVTYHLNSNVDITIKDKLTVSANYKTNVPKSLNDIFSQITKFKKTINDKKCCDKKDEKKSDFAYIMSLFNFFHARGLCGASMTNLMEDHDELVELLSDCFEQHEYKHTYLPIPAYSFEDFCGCCGGGGDTDPTNPAPTVEAGNNATITLPTNQATLTGQATGTGLTYLWTKDSGPSGSSFGTPTALSTTVTGLTQGTHVFRLTVTDNEGQTTYDTVTITVAAANAPTVDAGANQSITLPTSTATLTASGTGTGLTYAWTKDSGPAGGSITSPTNASTGITGLQEGTYVFRVTVTNNENVTATDTVTITVSPVPVPTTHPVNYGWTGTAVNSGNVASVSTPQQITVNNGAASFGFTVALEYVYLVISEPASEPVKVRYTNVLNAEPIPDYTWETPVVIGDKRYYFTKGPRGFDGSGATTFYTT